MDHLTSGGGGLVEAMQLRSLLTSGVLAGDGGRLAAAGGLRAIGVAPFPGIPTAAVRDVAGPVVAPAAGGPLDLVRHGVDGFLFEPRHDHSLRRSVRTLVLSDELRARFGEAGMRAVVGRTWETLGDELVEHYRRAMASVRDGAERASVR